MAIRPNLPAGRNTTQTADFAGTALRSWATVCRLGCEGIVSKRLGSTYRRGRSPLWVKVKNPNAPAVKREAEEDWGR